MNNVVLFQFFFAFIIPYFSILITRSCQDEIQDKRKLFLISQLMIFLLGSIVFILYEIFALVLIFFVHIMIMKHITIDKYKRVLFIITLFIFSLVEPLSILIISLHEFFRTIFEEFNYKKEFITLLAILGCFVLGLLVF